nr:integrase, catalytic region, zinc finger, CCHC-type, peptidase aspartic, catalytic [Tanacetum cinerariifolium]
MFMENPSSADPVYDEADLSYDSDILSESKDVLKMKADSLKEQTTTLRPIKALTVYPPNTPATLVPRRITPTCLTEGEKGFEQTKECYLTEVIPFFKTLKEHFEGIQKALTREIKEMKEIFKELEVEVDQNVCKLLAVASLIFWQWQQPSLAVETYTASGNSNLAVGMPCAFYSQHNAIKKLRMKISQLKETHSEADRTLDFKALDFQITQLTEKVTVLQEQNELFRAENAKIKQHYKELYAIDVEPILPRSRNRKVHLDYLKHLKESIETFCEIVEEVKFIGIVRFGNDHFGAIMGYGDYVIGDSVISRVYYVEGLRHNLFSIGQFCDSDLEVAFRKHSCYVRDTNGVELIQGSCGSNLYTISVEDMMKSSPIYLLSKASKNKSWLWHHCLNHLKFGTINDLARKDLVRGLPRLKFEKDHFCSTCQLGKRKKHTHKPKTKNTIMEVLHTLHMNLYGPI